MMVVKKKKKNPWITRRRNIRYKEINDIIEMSPDVSNALSRSQDILTEVGRTSKIIKSMRDKYDSIMSTKIPSQENILESLSVETLKDLTDIEKNGRPAKIQFRDFIEAGRIKRQAQDIIETKQNLVHEAQLVNIDLLQAKIEALIKLSEDKEDE